KPPPILAAALRDFLPRPRRPAPPAVAAEPRPARAAVVLGVAVLLQPRRHLHQRPARVPAACLSPSSVRLDRRTRPPEPRRPCLAGVGADRAGRLSRRLQDRVEL